MTTEQLRKPCDFDLYGKCLTHWLGREHETSERCVEAAAFDLGLAAGRGESRAEIERLRVRRADAIEGK